ncbi:MAG TPA: T9SS type A sorting domain-containing protein [Bacteroidetes bacterium]|nr:T9SS type A sorting domain-containing protein [Bacteroidota bacterium]
MRIPIAFLFVAFATLVFSQPMDDGKRDNIWLFGYDSYSQLPGFGRTVIDFSDLNAPDVYREDRDMDFTQTCSSICDVEGSLLFYTNGIYVANPEHEQMENGDNLNPGGWTTTWADVGLPVSQGIITLPVPDKEGKYMLFHGLLDFLPVLGPVYSNLYYSTVDMGLDGGLGAVVEKNVELVQDTLFVGKITATRHGNGRDWWVIIPENNTNRYYTFLLTPDSLYNMGAQVVGTSIFRGTGQAVFTPDGSRYLRYDIHAPEVGNNLNFYDFDRCTGLLSNQVELVNNDSAGAAGLAVSANSRFAYFSSGRFVYQYDLWATDLEASLDTVAIYDGHVSPWPHATTFYLAQLAPDNKVYINTPSGSNVLHVIHEPDRKGADCLMEQHGFPLESFNAVTMPNFPYFRLGPLDGSPCDTLGIDNVPVARFRYRQDTVNQLRVEFTDLSYFEPAEWQWDFGDTEVSQDTSPVHVFPGGGDYEVCLTVGNSHGEDTFCRILHFDPISTLDSKLSKGGIAVFPNPAKGMVNVLLPDGHLPQRAQIILYNPVGEIQVVEALRPGLNLISLDGLPPGIYFYEVKDGGVKPGSGKLVVVE